MNTSITRISPIISCALFFSFIPVGIADGALNAGQLTCDGWENPLGASAFPEEPASLLHARKDVLHGGDWL
jgi:hypothetical protein